MTSGTVAVGAATLRDSWQFVGRVAELAVLEQARARARAGRRQVVVVSGEAGIGKTRLCERAAERAERAGFRVVWGACWTHGGAPPLWPWPAVFAELVDAGGARLLAGGGGSGTVDPERFARFRAVAEMLSFHLDGQPTMVVIDDLHAADEAALLLTRFLARTVDSVPLLLVLARRSGDPSRGAGVERLLGDLEGDATVVPLRRFDLRDTSVFLDAHGLGDGDSGEVDLELARTVLHITDGNPLFLSRVVLHGSPSPGLAGVEQAVADAVNRLPELSRRMLGLLAVLGRTASVRDTADLAGQPVAMVLDALAVAQRAGLVEPVSVDRYRFGHDLIHQAAAATLTAAQRLDAHARAAALIGTSQRPEHLARRCHHALRAAARSDADARVAVDVCRTAARAMRYGFDYQQAAALLEAAVTVADSHPALPERSLLLVERAEAVLACGRLSAAREAFADAAAAVHGRSEPTLLARAALGLGGVWLNEHRDPVERCRVLATQRAALDALPDEEASLRCRLAVRLAAEAVYDGAPLADAQAALAEVRRVGDGRALAEALSLTHHAMLGPAHAAARLLLAEELLAVASAAGEGVLALFGLMWRTVDLFHLGDLRADRALSELRERADTLGCQSVLYVVAAMDVMRLVRAGRLEDAEAAAGACFELGVEMGDADAANFYGAQLTSIRWMQGRDGELLDLAVAGESSPTLGAADFAFSAAVAAMAAQVGRTEEAKVALDRLTEHGLVDLPQLSTWLTGMVAIMETAAAVGDTTIAGQVYRLIAPYAELPVMPSLAVTCLGSAERTLGVAALTGGDLSCAVGHFERAVEANRRIGNRPVTAISRAGLAEALTARAGDGDLARAEELLEQAYADAVAMNLRVRADQWDARLGAMTRRAARTGVLSRGRDGWTIAANGRETTVPDLQGMRSLAVLLERAGQDVSALELCGSTTLPAGRQEIADRHALDAYRRRLRQLDGLLAEADADGDADRAERLRRERDAVRDYLSRAVGLGGQARTFASSPERARIAVRKVVKRAFDAITAADPGLGAELQACITTGTTCRYAPDPVRPRRWTVRR